VSRHRAMKAYSWSVNKASMPSLPQHTEVGGEFHYPSIHCLFGSLSWSGFTSRNLYYFPSPITYLTELPSSLPRFYSTFIPVLLTEQHAMKASWGNGAISPRILDLGTGWRWVVSFTHRPLYHQGKSPWYQLDRRLGGPQSWSGSGGEETTCQALPGLETLIIQPVAQCYATALLIYIYLRETWILNSMYKNYISMNESPSLRIVEPISNKFIFWKWTSLDFEYVLVTKATCLVNTWR
jgi:hypothetical protein